MELMTIFSDESGYTGPNLTNKDQPYFVLATLSLEEDDAKAIRDSFFHSVKTRELKHSSLARNAKQHTMVLEYLKHLESHQNLFKVLVVDKEFAAVGKIVDYLVETAAHRAGLDLYSNGYVVDFANILYYSLVAYETSTYRSALLSKFEGMLRHSSIIRYNDFFDYIEQPVVSPTLNSVLDLVRATRHVLNPNEILKAGPEALDLTFTTALALMAAWRKQTGKDFNLIHDVSSPMVKESKLWEALTDKSLPPATVGYGQKTIQFPIGMASTSFEDSRLWVGLQLADVLAGSFARTLSAYKRGDFDSYVGLIAETVFNLPAHSVMPATPDDFNAESADYEPPADALEFIGEFYAKTRPRDDL